MTTSAQNLTSRNERVINTQTLGALPSIEYGLIRAHVFASLVTLVISVLFGILVATKFTFPEFLGGHGWLTWGRLRYNHKPAQGIFSMAWANKTQNALLLSETLCRCAVVVAKPAPVSHPWPPRILER